MASRPRFNPLAALAFAGGLAACGPTHRAQWTSQGPNASPFAATLFEDTYNDGDSIIYTLRFEKTERRAGGGWFVRKDIYGDDGRPRRPDLVWTSPRDLTVVVHTARIEGRVVQRFVNQTGSDGSLTFDYRPDGLGQ